MHIYRIVVNPHVTAVLLFFFIFFFSCCFTMIVITNLYLSPIDAYIAWWKHSHNVHHIITNHPEHDPDIQHLPGE